MLSNCSQCQYFSNPHHSGDIVCGLQPSYASMWQRLNSLDQYTLDTIPVDHCREFVIDPSLEKQEISLSLTFEQWKQLILESHCPTIILKSLRNHAFQHSLSLTLQQWQVIADSSGITCLLEQLEAQGIKPNYSDWISVDSSCINAIAFDESTNFLKIRFHNGSVYQYSDFDRLKFSDFRNSSSLGRFFHDEIKDFYSFSQLE
ncbi:MAG: KTSC domain-containing protein [Pleurocapsa sp. CRU_1_2]|nr:KTSC domain-containing protein [Pleurocapsa sp. CRU_1_2]